MGLARWPPNDRRKEREGKKEGRKEGAKIIVPRATIRDASFHDAGWLRLAVRLPTAFCLPASSGEERALFSRHGRQTNKSLREPIERARRRPQRRVDELRSRNVGQGLLAVILRRGLDFDRRSAKRASSSPSLSKFSVSQFIPAAATLLFVALFFLLADEGRTDGSGSSLVGVVAAVAVGSAAAL